MSQPKRSVLVIDDESGIRRLLCSSLESAGYRALEASTGKEGLQVAMSRRPDCYILDLNLPDLSGLEVLASLRAWTQAPVLILSVEDSEASKVALLDSGADDYLIKPFGVPELLARMRVLERRLASGANAVIQSDGLEIDLAAHSVKVDGEEIRLSQTEYEFLRVLAQHAGRVVTQRQLLREVWGPNSVEHTHYLRIYAAALRKKLEKEPSKPRWILTDPGVGYRLKA